jgi:hypothetical protein
MGLETLVSISGAIFLIAGDTFRRFKQTSPVTNVYVNVTFGVNGMNYGAISLDNAWRF